MPSSQYNQSLSRWFQGPTTKIIPVWVYWSIGGIVLLLSLASLAVIWLRRKVETRTLELRINEAKLSHHIMNTPLGSISFDLDFHITEWNKSAENIFGYSADEVIGRHVSGTIVPAEIKDEINVAFQLLLDNDGGTQSTNENLTKDGKTIVCDWYNTPITGENGEVAGVTSLVQDITERKIMGEELQNALTDAVRANKAKSEFLAAMSHDLRTPLNAIMGFSDMMRAKTFGPLGNEYYDQYADDIHSSGALLTSLINDVLDLSKVEAGKYELFEEPLDVSSTINDSLRQLKDMAETRNLSPTSNIISDMPQILGDERVMIQILNNLLSNAIKFTPDGGRVIINASVDEGSIVLSVTDTGIGMSDEDLAKAQKPFEQADGFHSRRNEGTGLGLYLCVNFMKLFGGTLDIESEIDIGTAVTLRFPAERTIQPL